MTPRHGDLEADDAVDGLGTALLDALDAGQDLLVAQIAMTTAELRSDGVRLARGTAVLYVGVGWYLLGHGAIALAVGLALSTVIDPRWAVAVVGVPHLVSGGVAIAFAALHLSQIVNPEVR